MQEKVSFNPPFSDNPLLSRMHNFEALGVGESSDPSLVDFVSDNLVAFQAQIDSIGSRFGLERQVPIKRNIPHNADSTGFDVLEPGRAGRWDDPKYPIVPTRMVPNRWCRTVGDGRCQCATHR